MKLTYWYAQAKTDSNCYSIRAKTRKACYQELEAWSERRYEWEKFYNKPVKVEVEYKDAFDLMNKYASGEDRLANWR